MINSKLTKQIDKQTNEERLFKLLESIDWKLWEIYNMMKDSLPEKTAKKSSVKKPTSE
jgi:hypothetical protein